MKRRIYFRADASATIGYGHFIRTLALADMLKNDFDCTFFTCQPTSYQIGEMEKVCPFVALHEEIHFGEFLSRLQGDEIVVLDNYFFATDYQRSIKQKGCRLVCIDDMHDKHYVADVVVNHGQINPALFDVEPYTKLCLGFDWALLRKPFLECTKKRRTNEVKNVVVCFGGSDYLNLTQKFIDLLLDKRTEVHISAIVGDKYHTDRYISSSQVGYLQNLSATEVAHVFMESDLAILPTSGVCLEALACGTPIAAGFFVDNQEKIYEEYFSRGLIYALGDLRNFVAEKFDIDKLCEYAISDTPSVSMNMVSINYIRMFNSCFVFDDITIGSCNYQKYSISMGDNKLVELNNIRNDDRIRCWMENKELIPFEDHLHFVTSLLNADEKIYWAVYKERKLIGSINIEYKDKDIVERGIYVVPDSLGKSVGAEIEAGLNEILQKLYVRKVIVKVLKNNERSLRFHLKVGYKQVFSDNKYYYLEKYCC